MDNSKRLAAIVKKIAKIDDGPVGVVLDRYWNTLHDLESALERAKRDYGVASSYSGKGQADAEYMMEQIDIVLGEVSNIATKSFSHLVEKESMYLKKWGTPDDHVKKRRDEIFPN